MFKKSFAFLLILFIVGFMLPEHHVMPVQGATQKDWNSQSFWYYPWGRSRVHKGIDIFAKQGTPVRASTGGIVLFSGNIQMGGQVVYMLGAHWRFHYFAHLDSRTTSSFSFVDAGQQIGTVGSSGNAKGKSPHLHYSIKSFFPRIWTYNPKAVQAWNKLFFIDPADFLSRKT